MRGFVMLVRVEAAEAAWCSLPDSFIQHPRQLYTHPSQLSRVQPDAEMDGRSKPQLLTLLALFSVLLSQTTLAWPLYSPPSAVKLDDVAQYEGANEPDQVSLKEDTDILQNALAENDTPYYEASRKARHADGVFTSEYSKLLGQLSAKKYLESLIGKRVSNVPIKRHSDAVFTDNYTRLRKQMAVKKYLSSILNGKRSNEGDSVDFPEELEK